MDPLKPIPEDAQFQVVHKSIGHSLLGAKNSRQLSSTTRIALPLRGNAGRESRSKEPATSDQKYTADVTDSKSHINLI